MEFNYINDNKRQSVSYFDGNEWHNNIKKLHILGRYDDDYIKGLESLLNTTFWDDEIEYLKSTSFIQDMEEYAASIYKEVEKVSSDEIGAKLAEMVKNEYKKDGIEINYLSSNTADWLEEIRHAEDFGHFEYNYHGNVKVFDLKVEDVTNDDGDIIDQVYYI